MVRCRIHGHRSYANMQRYDTLSHVRKSAEQGDPFAQFELGLVYDDWSEPAEAAKWYLKAARQAHESAICNYCLLFALGSIKTRNSGHVVNWLRKRALGGNAFHQNNLGLCYYHGRGMRQSYKKALHWYRKAARAGIDAAQFNLGGMYFEGKLVPKSNSSALKWYSLAAQQRNVLALLQLGQMYNKGIGVTEDANCAFLLYLCALRRGSSRAIVHLASMYKNARA